MPPSGLGSLYSSSRLSQAGVDLDAPALADGTTSLSWSDAIERCGRLASLLDACGVAAGDRVAVRLPKSVDAFVAVHAVVRLGAVMVPIDPSAPSAMVRRVLADAGADVVITDDRAASIDVVSDAPGVHTIVCAGGKPIDPARIGIGRHQRAFGREDIDAMPVAEPVAVAPDDPAYIIFTSGSTGVPKGIVHTHASAWAYAVASAAQYGVTSDDRLANIAPLHFDQSTFELYTAPLVGASVLVVPEPVLKFPASLSELVARERITIWYSVPYLLVQLARRGVLHERDLGALRWVLFGGESFPPDQLAALMRLVPSATFSNVYGPAEVNQCTVHDLDAPPDPGVTVPIGRAWAVADTRVIELGDDDRAVPGRPRLVDPGERGQLLVGSPTMMARYWNRPDLTAAAIVEIGEIAPSSGLDRWYRTGDVVVEAPDGILTFFGRADNQVKIRGYRIELEAIDEIVRDVPGVVAAIVVVDRVADRFADPVGEPGDDRIVALVVVDPAAGFDVDDITAGVVEMARQRLPRYALPDEVRIVASLPRTATDKIDRSAARGLLRGSDT
ncbi:MAG: AMP-binding protein [Ilumatobacter sp.]|uniref:AMP-binding protein n=1 Tax=Ilumatobacter sp. TaxID=1967498 RepID=UPI003919D39B